MDYDIVLLESDTQTALNFGSLCLDRIGF